MSNTAIDGMIYPTTKGMVGANPADSARLSMVNKAQSQTTANKLMAGGKIKRTIARYGGASASSSITVPQYQMMYEPQGGVGTNPNDQIQGNSQTSTQMTANSVYDKYANKMGGSKSNFRKSRKSRKGGNPDWLWGCMSGGKKRSRRGRRTSRRRNKHKKTRKNRRH
jgi:hypothetical protein